ncbi:hypothetical protein TSOC_009363 [Tetrabaena socialis]|uniref:Uncharacterized protein n=1 Tax=Tetrabaena socialis TaxID=47790 RepID=A0A2J7ZW42_9CHLO|nr:hypothetical protein TSOC_009363 [Tetrabaena socialis]|eukprot:PNH04472.1 hypothetical protein TSOC_009363 [Tetrabaena socialis]
MEQQARRPHALLAQKSRVLPFSLGREEAALEWQRHHQGLLTSPPGGSRPGCKSVLLPFWCIAAEAQVTVHSAQETPTASLS